ncbi:hypothetical protein O3P69_013196 [Scylla paramamosain]|uniref:Uncharacterized protein n=1 Tax=Scylla paramamosain TaxID=85552 RepID=A0AAW0U0X9_SCYPA
MLETGVIIGITFIVIGSLMTVYGIFTWATSKGSVYNAEDVDAMVTATVMEQEKQRQQEEALFTDFRPGEMNKKKKVLMA